MKRDINDLRLFVQSGSIEDYVRALRQEKPQSFRLPGKLRAILLAFALFWLGFCGGGYYSNARGVFRECRFLLRAQTVQAAVRQIKPLQQHGEVELTLVYRVDGTDYTTRQFLPANDPRLAGRSGPELDTRPFTLYCDASDPSHPRLSREPRRVSELDSLVFLGPFIAIGLGLLYLAVTGHAGLWIAWAIGFMYVYTPLSAVSAFALFGASMVLPGAWGLGIGLGMILGYPLISLLGVRLFADRMFRKFKAKAVAELAAMEIARGEGAPPLSGESAPPAAPSTLPGEEPAPSSPTGVAPGVEVAQLPPGSFWREPRVGSGAKGMAFLLVFALFWCGITGTGVSPVVRAFYRSALAQTRYRTTEGTVLSSGVYEIPGGEDTTYDANLRYAYTVNGTAYTGRRYAYGPSGFSSGRYHYWIVAQCPAGRNVTVYYDPLDPSECTLSTKVKPGTCFVALFFQPFLVVGLGLLGGTLYSPFGRHRLRRFLDEPLRVPCRIPTWGPLRGDALETVLRPGGRGLCFVGGLLGGYGLSTFLLTFVVGFLLGGFESPNPTVIGGALLFALGVGVLAGATYCRRSARKAVVSLDKLQRRLRVVSPRRQEELSLDRLQCWLLRMIDNPRRTRSDGDKAQAPLLAVVSRDGREIPVHVFNADADAPLIARRAGQFLAELTQRPLRAIEPENAAPSTPGGVLDAVRSFGWTGKGSGQRQNAVAPVPSGDLEDLT